MISCTRRLQFCAGHRVFRHESKCNNLHGHNYVALLTARGVATPLDPLGRVIDFSVIKEKVGGWVDANWDHGFLYFEDDAEVSRVLGELGHKRYAMRANPTAENMARELLERGNEALASSGVEIVRVELWETENCRAEYEA